MTGEMGVFTGQIRSTRIIVDETSDVLLLSSEGLDEMLEEDPQMGNHMLANLIKLLYARLYDVNQEVEALRGQVSQLKERVQTLSPDDPLLASCFPIQASNPRLLRWLTGLRRKDFNPVGGRFYDR